MTGDYTVLSMLKKCPTDFFQILDLSENPETLLTKLCPCLQDTHTLRTLMSTQFVVDVVWCWTTKYLKKGHYDP